MRTIWKYPLEATDHQELMIPSGAKILDAQFQAGQLCLWAMVNTARGSVERRGSGLNHFV